MGINLDPRLILPRASALPNLDIPIACLAGKHQPLDFRYNPQYGVPMIHCRSCGRNLSEDILNGVVSKKEVNRVQEQAKAKRTTPLEILDRLALTHEQDRLRDPQLRRLVEERKKRLERNRK